MKETSHWPRGASGQFSLPRGWDDWPVFGISWNDATDYCKWLTAQKGGEGWRFELPTEDEWERAARGADGRFFPWGDRFDPSFCRGMLDSRPEQRPPNPEPFGLFPIDESFVGVRDLGGGMREWTATVSGRENRYRIMKGGVWSGSASISRSALRDDLVPRGVSDFYGFRLVARSARP